MAKVDYEFIPNYKVLQMAFEKNSIERYIDVDKLIRAKHQDNMVFLQFMKRYWELEGSTRPDYDPGFARAGKALPAWCQLPRSQDDSLSDVSVVLDASAPRGRASQAHPTSADLGLQAEKQRLEEESQELRAIHDGLRKERDYYLRRVRLVEMRCS